MSSVSQVTFAAAVANELTSDEKEIVEFIEWLPLILPLIMALPCFKPKPPAEKQAWIINHPTLSRNEAMRQLKRTQTEKTRRHDRRETADAMLEEVAAMSPEEFAELCV